MVPSTSMKSPLRCESSPDAKVLPVALAFSVSKTSGLKRHDIVQYRQLLRRPFLSERPLVDTAGSGAMCARYANTGVLADASESTEADPRGPVW